MSTENRNTSEITTNGNENSVSADMTPEPNESQVEKKSPVIKYTPEELLQYRNHPLSLTPPKSYFIFGLLSCWKTPLNAGGKHEGDETAKRNRHNSESKDPRDRIRRESDGIILSPQRANFNKGCFVDPTQPTGPPQKEVQSQQQTANQQPQRRIGSGRIVNRDRDCDNGPFRSGRDERGDRGHSNVDKGISEGEGRFQRGNDHDGRYHKRGDDRRNNARNNNPKVQETPEWFSDGPTSQNETIELYGFEDSRVSPPFPAKTASPKPAKIDEEETLPKGCGDLNQAFTKYIETFEFSFFSNDELSNDNSQPKSRFSQFFTMEKNGETENVPKSAEEPMSNMQQNPALAEQHSNFFAPIDPAPGSSVSNFFGMLRREGNQSRTLKDLAAKGKMTNVQELEARMLNAQVGDNSSMPMQPTSPAFGSQNINAKKLFNLQDHPDLSEDKLKQFEQQHLPEALLDFTQQPVANCSSPTSLAKHIVPPLPPDIVALISTTQVSLDLLARPEAQAIISGMQEGQISVQNLIYQLQNSHMQTRYRDVLACILKIIYLQHNQLMANHHNNGVHRVPSPRELMIHTANIMQNALIKKKLEEQQENYKKRQQSQQSQGTVSPRNTNARRQQPQTSASYANAQQLSFTPTSVLRKMTEKDERVLRMTGKPLQAPANTSGAAQVHQNYSMMPPTQWVPQQRPAANPPILQPHLYQGRPIIKAVGPRPATSESRHNFMPQHRPVQSGPFPGQMVHPMFKLNVPPANRPPIPFNIEGPSSPNTTLHHLFGNEQLRMRTETPNNMMSVEELERIQYNSRPAF